jgi:hypothetical protein
MSQPNAPAPAPQAADAAVPVKKVKKVKDNSGGGGVRGIFSKITRKLVWVFSGIIFAGIFFWGLIEIALYGPTPTIPIAGLVGKFSIDRFLLLGGIVALIPPAIVYLMESKRRDSIDNNIPHLIRDNWPTRASVVVEEALGDSEEGSASLVSRLTRLPRYSSTWP